MELQFFPTEFTVPDPDRDRSTFVETFIWEPAAAGEFPLGNLYIVGQVISSYKRSVNAGLLFTLANLIKEEYYRKPERDIVSAFKFALGKANSFLEREAASRRFRPFKLNAAAAVLAAEKIQAALIGEVELIVVRAGKAIAVKMKPTTSFTGVATGDIIESDVVILSTPQIHKLSFEQLGPLAASNKLVPFLTENKSEFRNLGCIAVAVGQQIERTHTIGARTSDVTGATLGHSPIVPKRLNQILISFIVIGAITAVTLGALSLERSISRKNRETETLLAKTQELEERTAQLLKVGNFEEAERTFEEWRQVLGRLEELKTKKPETKAAQERAALAEPQVLRYETITPREIVNFQNNAVGFNPTGLTVGPAELVLFDEHSLYTFSLATKSGRFTLLPPNILLREVLPHPTGGGTLYIRTNNAIVEYSREGLKPIFAVEEGRDIKRTQIYNDTPYLLENSNVFYLKPGGLIEPWLKAGVQLKNSRDFAIDGFIYVLGETKISKFLNGALKEEFKVDLASNRIFTQVGFRHLYILNPQEGRVTVMEKTTGLVRRRLHHQLIQGAQTIALSDNEKTLYFLNSEKVFSIEL